MFTRQQIEAIDVGTEIAWSLDGVRFGRYEPVTSVTCRRDDIRGKLFVHGYRRHGDCGGISFSIKEGNATDAKLYRVRGQP